MFLAPWFAIAGLAAAAGPILIHLLNRQRFRVVEWAAMDFLRQAVRRSRRILRLRDLLLMLLRALAVLAFGLALARPYLTSDSAAINPDQPVHAVLVIDNSLSMSVEQLNKPLLDEAKKKAKDFIGRLPLGSRISILPLCGSATEYNRGAYSTKEDALEALAAVEPVDRLGKAADAVSQAVECCRRVTSPSAKQVVFISDQQAVNWPAQSLETHFKQLDSPMEIVQVSARDADNAWIADFRLQDAVADPATPAIFLATIRYEGVKPRSGVQVTLSVEGVTVATQTVDFEPGQTREVRFPPYQFDVTPEPGRPSFVAAEVTIPHDVLPADDRRVLIVPVVASLPVVFVDQYGADEDPQRNRFGETFRLRRLLAPVTTRHQPERQLVQVVHKKIDQLDQEILATARLVVIAGVANPEGKTPLLRQYVEQGGRLLIAAGGEFDPAAWNESAWLDGQGILPAPLKPAPVGRLPGAAGGPLTPFQLDFTSMEHHHYFLLEQTSHNDLEDLYRLPYFFMAIDTDASTDTLERLNKRMAADILKNRGKLTEINQRLTQLTEREIKGNLTDSERQERIRLEQNCALLKPQWLLWNAGQQTENEDAIPVERLVERGRPRVIARFSNKIPYMIERDLGAGQVLFVSSGVYRDWNTLTVTNAVVVFDRILHDMLDQTLPRRSLSTSQRLVLPVPPEQHRARFALIDPAGHESALSVDAIGPDRYGVGLANLPQRGIYRVVARGTKDMAQVAADAKLWEIAVAVNGPAEESDLRALDETSLAERMGQGTYRWVGQGQSIQMAAAPQEGRDLWQWLLIVVFAALAVEMAILALPALRTSPEPTA